MAVHPKAIEESLAGLAGEITNFREAISILNAWLSEKANIGLMQDGHEWILCSVPGHIVTEEVETYPSFSLALKAALERVDGA